MRTIGGKLFLIAAAVTWLAPTTHAMHFDPSGAAALREVANAQDGITKAYVNLLRNFTASDEYQKALADVRKTNADFQQARAEALGSWQQSQQYKSAQFEISNIQEQLDSVQSDQRSELASELLSKRIYLSKMESMILKENRALREARYAMLDAQSKAAAIRQSFVDSIRTNPQWRAAKTQLDQARNRATAMAR